MMTNTISEESKTFLENLRLYLFSSGKKETEINEIVDELEAHLTEAEAKGKNVNHIIGYLPEEYMKQIANELPAQKGKVLQYITVITLGVISYDVITNAVTGDLSYSLLKVAGTLLIVLLFTALLAATFKMVATKNMSTAAEFSLYSIVGIMPLLLFIGLIYLDRTLDIPVIHFSTMGTWIAVAISILFLIGMSIWAKTWAVLVILFLLILPELIFKQVNVPPSTELIVSSAITFGGLGLYAYFTQKNLK